MKYFLIANDLKRLVYEGHGDQPPYIRVSGEGGEVREFELLDNRVFPGIYVESGLMSVLGRAGKDMEQMKHAAATLWRLWEDPMMKDMVFNAAQRTTGGRANALQDFLWKNVEDFS